MRFPSDLLKPVIAVPVVLGVLAIAGWWAYLSERSELAATNQTLAAVEAQHQELQATHEQLQADADAVRSTLADT
jgi:outer membrane murein-binding lipoprotein Lpp